MINSATDADSFIKEVQAISAVDPFACRIISLCNSYKPDLVFVDYWLVQDDSGKNTGAIARNGSNFILLLTGFSVLLQMFKVLLSLKQAGKNRAD